jgi:hypothetical protein
MMHYKDEDDYSPDYDDPPEKSEEEKEYDEYQDDLDWMRKFLL